MERIIDIYGYKTYFDQPYELEDTWFGRVVLKENQTFEGIVEDYYQTSKSMVFGTIGESSIELTQCTKGDDEVPYFYDAKEEDGRFYGDYFAKNPYVVIPLGECKLSVFPSEKTREYSETELKELKKEIIRFKHNLGEVGETLYQRFELARVEEKPKEKVNKQVR